MVKSHCASARWQKPALADLANSIKTETCRKDLWSVKGVRTKDSHGSHLQACGKSHSDEDPLIAGWLFRELWPSLQSYLNYL